MVYSGLWDGVAGEGYAFNKRQHSPNNYHLARILKKRNMRELSEHITNLITDATPATTSSVSYPRVAHVAAPGENAIGGVATIETHQLVGGDNGLFGETDHGATGAKASRAVTANDGTDIQQYLEGGDAANRAPSVTGTTTYIEDSSGNGGGGKQSTGG